MDDEPAAPSVESAPNLAQPLPEQSTEPLSDDELREWLRAQWPEEIRQLASFGRKSWGTAYQAIAEVQLLLQIGKTYQMTINLAIHNVSSGWFIDRDRKEKRIEFRLLGSYLNNQSPGTWTNKLTFFFAVYHFLAQTEAIVAEDLGRELHEARQAMLSWGVSLKTPACFLPTGDARTAFRLTPLHGMIRRYMVCPLWPTLSIVNDFILQGNS